MRARSLIIDQKITLLLGAEAASFEIARSPSSENVIAASLTDIVTTSTIPVHAQGRASSRPRGTYPRSKPQHWKSLALCRASQLPSKKTATAQGLDVTVRHLRRHAAPIATSLAALDNNELGTESAYPASGASIPLHKVRRAVAAAPVVSVIALFATFLPACDSPRAALPACTCTRPRRIAAASP